MYAKAWDRKIGMLQNKIKALRQKRGAMPALSLHTPIFQNPFAIEGNEFDKNPWLLGVKNGVIDLRSGELYPGEPKQLISKQCSCNYVSLDACNSKDWQDFLSIYNGDKSIDFMQMLLGYGITGLTTEHIFPFLLGRGRNGKSLFIASVIHVLGDYAGTIPSELFLKNNP